MQVSILALKCCSTVHLFAFIPPAFNSNAAFPLAGTLHAFYRWKLSEIRVSVCEQGGSIHSPLHQYLYPSPTVGALQWGKATVIRIWLQTLLFLKKTQHRSNKILPNNFLRNNPISTPRQNTAQHRHKRLRIGSNQHPEAHLHFLHGTLCKHEVHRLN